MVIFAILVSFCCILPRKPTFFAIFFSVVPTCCLKLSFSSISTPKYFIEATLAICSPSRLVGLSVCSGYFLDFSISTTFVLSQPSGIMRVLIISLKIPSRYRFVSTCKNLNLFRLAPVQSYCTGPWLLSPKKINYLMGIM
jgi:hypothetical protein